MVDQQTHRSDGIASSDDDRDRRDGRLVRILALASATAVAIANASGISIGDDGVGYQAIADSLLSGNGIGYFLEDPVTVWPPLWPGAMAFVARITPFGTVGAAVVLNCIVAGLTVLVGNRLIRLVVTDRRLILAGTAVLTIGPATIGLGHVLMTDMAFTLVVMAWMIILLAATRNGSAVDADTADGPGVSMSGLLTAALLAWIGFGLRYIGLTLIAFGGLWLLFSAGRPWPTRVRNAVVYGLVASIVPVAWMVRNHSIDGTFTGERHTSARGLVHNLYDIAATIGRFTLPGVLNEAAKLWAPIGVIGVVAAAGTAWWLLAGRDPERTTGIMDRLRRAVALVSTPAGLVTTWTVLYLAYMLYVRTTTALNVLDLRLLFPAYFPMLIMGLALVERAGRRSPATTGAARLTSAVSAWAAVNVVTGLVAMIGFGLGHPFFKGDYASKTFVAVRENPALDAIPDGCETYSNLPNALYPTVEPRGWSPQRTALESIDPVDDLERISRRSADHDVCLVWIDEKPAYWHLWPLQDLEEKLLLTPLAENGPVAVYRVRPPRAD